MNHGKQIRLFLTDGSATGIRYAELMNWTGQAFACPKGLFGKLKEWPESQRAGVYVLLGLNASGEEVAYIGESENVIRRILEHVGQSTLDEIVKALFFTSKDDNLTKGHTTFLERRLISRAQDVQQYIVQCDREPSEKILSRPEIATMEEYLENLYLVASALGFVVFESTTEAAAPRVDSSEFALDLRESGVSARGYTSDLGFVVRKDSRAVSTDTSSLSLGYRALKEDLKKKAVLVADGPSLKFAQDYTFSSSSAAAGVVSGNARSGPQSWARQDGKTLKEVEEEKARVLEAAVASHPGGDHAQPLQ